MSGPQSIEGAFEWAGMHVPELATDIRYAGEAGIDSIVYLQFALPNLDAARSLLAPYGCTLQPIQRRRDNPFRLENAGAPPWWVSDAPDGAWACRAEATTSDPLYRFVRVDPQNARVRVQMTANTQ